MKKWKCTVCGYIHEGDEPPAECPVCKAAADKFVEIEVSGAVKRWKCTVCGHIHEGDKPPAECPVCKAGAGAFVEIDAAGNTITAAGQTQSQASAEKAREKRPVGFFSRMVLKLHLHPIAVHTPNGLLPVAVVFLALSTFLGLSNFESVAFYNLVFVLLIMPIVLGSGYIEWKKRYNGVKSALFLIKISCSVIVTLSLATLVGWRFVAPGVAGPDSAYRLIYFGIAAVMVAAAGLAGHLGGKLVFGSRDLVISDS